MRQILDLNRQESLPTVLNCLHGVRRSGAGWIARCPAHEDNEPSLSVNVGAKGHVLVHCFAGCSFRAVADALRREVEP